MKKNKLLLVSLFAIMAICSCNGNNNSSSQEPTSEASIYVSYGTSEEVSENQSSSKELNEDRISQIINGDFEVLLNSVKTEDVVSIHTEKQKNYLNDNYNNVSNYANGDSESSKPNPVTLTWESNLVNENVVDYYQVNVSENSDMSSSWVYKCEDTTLDVYNLKVGTTYYWNVETKIQDLTFKTETYSFETADEVIRNIYIDGVTNARDLGGWKISETQRVKQGLMYRTGRLNKNYMNIVSRQITAKGREMMTNYLGIKTEMDLRRVENNEVGSITSSPIGSSVNYYQCPMVYDSEENTLVNNSPMIREIFKVLSDESNYPLFYHCSIGTDRTGVICFLINALLGVEEEYLYKDYLFSMFGHITVSRMPSTIDKYIEMIKPSQGTTLQEKTYNYLVGLGVAESDLNNLIDIMTN